MGKTIQVFLDIGGKQRAKLIDNVVNEARPAVELSETDTVKDIKHSEVKSDEKLPKNQPPENDSSRRRYGDAPSKSASSTDHSALLRRQSSPSHQQSTSKYADARAVPQPPVLYPPPPVICLPPASRQSIGPLQDADLFATSEPEYVINSGSSPQVFDREEGEIGSEDSESSDSESEDDGEEASESLEQRIQALLTGKDPKAKEAKVSGPPQAPLHRVDIPKPPVVADAKLKNPLPFIENANSNVMPPSVPPPSSAVVDQPIMPFPFPMPPPPPFALPPGIRPPPPAIFVTKEQHGALFTSTFELLIAELRRTLYRDLCRRLLEQCAFRHLDSWWVKNEIRSRAKKQAEETNNSAPGSQVSEHKESQKLSQNESQTSLLSNGATENDGWEKIFRQGGVFGLRDTLPKLPSFRRKDTQPPPSRNQITTTDATAPTSNQERLQKISESGSDNSVADFPVSPKQNDSNSVADDRPVIEDEQKRRWAIESKRKKAILSDSDDDISDLSSSSSSSSSSSASSSLLEDFSSSSESEEEQEEELSESSTEKKKDSDKKNDSSMISPKEDANSNTGAANRSSTPPMEPSKTMSSPVTSPQKPKARWAMFLQVQEQQPTTNTTSDGNNDGAAAPAVQNSAATEPETKQSSQPEKQAHSERGRPKGSKSKIVAPKNKPSQRNKRKSQAEVLTSESSESDSSSSAGIEEESEEDYKPKGKKKTPAQTKKVTPARRNASQVKPRQGSTKAAPKESQQQKIGKPTAQVQPTSPRKPVVKRVNTVPNVVAKEETPVLDNADSERCDMDTEDPRYVADPLLPDFLIDHCYVPVSQLHQQIPLQQKPPPEPVRVQQKPTIVFKPRDRDQEEAIATSFMRYGIDAEDLQYLERSYEELLQNYSQSYYWLNETHWVKHPPTVLSASPIVENEQGSPRKKRRVAVGGGGCARCDLEWRGGRVARSHGPAGTETVEVCETSISQGRINLLRGASESGSAFVATTNGPGTSTNSTALERLGADIGKTTKLAKAELREARSHQRRLLACFSSGLPEEKRDILGFNLLKYRKKRVRFARSGIHGWGLYALEPIAAEEMVVEYAGELVRKTVGDLREKKYARLGVDGSYMFRVDEDLIVDATMAGNYGRFINHSCAPNCYAKVITVDGQKKIVIYSKREIAVSEEITYDYKFPLEPAANKIVCHCAASTCRQTLN